MRIPSLGAGTRVVGAAALVPLLASGAWAHPGRPLEPHDLWSSWSLEPGVLLVIGLSAMLYARGVGRLWRRAGVGRGVPRWRFNCFAAGLAALFLALVSPLDAMGGALWIWHAPALYQAALTIEIAHIAQHGSFLASAVLFSWVLLHPARFRLRAYGAAVLYVFTAAVHGSLLGALLTFAGTPWYPAYAPSARAWGLSALEDQQLGGLIMWIPPGVLHLCVALAALAIWLRRIELRQPGSPGRLYPKEEEADVAPLPI